MEINSDQNLNNNQPNPNLNLEQQNLPNLRIYNPDEQVVLSEACQKLFDYLAGRVVQNHLVDQQLELTHSFEKALQIQLSRVEEEGGTDALFALRALYENYQSEFNTFQEYCALAKKVADYLGQNLSIVRLHLIANCIAWIPSESDQEFCERLNKLKNIALKCDESTWTAFIAAYADSVRTGNAANETKNTINVFHEFCQLSDTTEYTFFTEIISSAYSYGWNVANVLKLALNNKHELAGKASFFLQKLHRQRAFIDEQIPIQLCNFGNNLNKIPDIFCEQYIALCQGLNLKSQELVNSIQTLSKATTFKNLNRYAFEYIIQRAQFLKERGIDPVKALTDFMATCSQAELLDGSQAAVSTLLYQSDNAVQRQLARDYLVQNFKADQHPVPIDNTAEMEAALRKTQSVYRGALDAYHGFASLQHAAKTYDLELGSMLQRVGEDLAEGVGIIQAGDINAYPGRGVVIKGLNPATFLTAPGSVQNDFSVYRQAWPWLSKAIDSVQGSIFYFMRGAIVIQNEGEQFMIDLGDRKEPYSLLIVNDHFHNYAKQVAYLIPSILVDGKLKGSIKNVIGLESQNNTNDVNLKDFTPEGLLSAAKKYGAPVLTIATPSVFCGGLCNAFPPNSDPYFIWERREGSHWRDLNGHLHKSFAFSFYTSTLTPEMERLFTSLNAVSDNIYQVSSEYFAHLSLFQFAHSVWNKGANIPKAEVTWSPEPQDNDQNEENEGNEDNQDQQADSEQPSLNIDMDHDPYFRMLDEAQIIHESLRAKGVTLTEKYPVLYPAATFRYAQLPGDAFTLDTYDLVLKLKNGAEFKLAGKSIEYKRMVWTEHVMPLYFTDSNTDLRFYDKK